MFCGIIEELGGVKRISKKGNVTLITVSCVRASEDTKLGDSIAVNGVCLTVARIDKGILSFEAVPETTKITTLGSLRIGDKVNLERSLRIGDRIGGHFVLGHIDCLGTIRKKNYINGNLAFEVAMPIKFARYCIQKGSISLDGISLTIAEKKSDTFSVYVIPHTLKNTTLGFKGPSDKVNIEFDILAKK